MITFSVTHNGIPISNYEWNEETRTFSTNGSKLIIDFGEEDGITFKTRDGCTFNTGSSCTFITGDNCIFKTDSYCNFITGYNCNFITGYNCTFITKDGSIFKTGSDCTFNVGKKCVGIRWDVKGVTEFPANKTVKNNKYKVSGFTIVEPDNIALDFTNILVTEE